MTAPDRASLLFLLGAIIGVLLAMGGFFWDTAFAGIPYQDPTPELQAMYVYHHDVAESLEVAGLVALAVCVPAFVFSRWYANVKAQDRQ